MLGGTGIRLIYSLSTLYMMAILLRWTASWLDLDVYSRRLRWIAALTDPLINRMRALLPSMGPMDWGPLAALFIVWVFRELALAMALGAS